MSSSVPDTDSREVAAFAIAWEIVKQAYNVPNVGPKGDTGVRELSNAVVKSYLALVSAKPIEG